MKIIRTIWLLAITIVFLPMLILIAAGWFIWCIRCAKQLSMTVTDGVKWWWKYLKAGIRMNKDFIINGL